MYGPNPPLFRSNSIGFVDNDDESAALHRVVQVGGTALWKRQRFGAVGDNEIEGGLKSDCCCIILVSGTETES